MAIPKIIHQIWIGPLPAPTKWMQTWQDMNPDWEYMLWDNDKCFSRKWRNQWMIDAYLYKADDETFQSARQKTFTGEKATLFHWHVIADILRYEILFEYGGYMPGADTECVKPLTGNAPWLNYDLYTVNTGHLFTKKLLQLDTTNPLYKLLRKRYNAYNASPILAASKNNTWLRYIIKELGKTEHLGEAVDTTGNVFMGKMLRQMPPQNAMIGKYYLKDDPRRQEVYSRHYSGTTKGSYAKGR
jgi:hypothetical protein